MPPNLSAEPSPEPAVVSAPAEAPSEATEISRDGASRIYALRASSSVVEQAVEEHLTRMGKTVRLPGFRPGKIPMALLRQRYGAQTRTEVIHRIAAETAQRVLPKGSIVSAFNLRAGAQSGDLEFHATVTYLPDLPPADFSQVTIERLDAAEADLQTAGLTATDAAALFRQHLKLQVLDHLDAAYPIPVLPFLIEREFAAIWKAAEAEAQAPADQAERESLAAEFRAIAERRLRLGMVVAEIARRNGIRAQHSAELEDKVVDLLVTQARVQERQASVEELRELIQP
jgi:FKBP-type peptidyl-prolyl cis-trans isomerase (trigger factor)